MDPIERLTNEVQAITDIGGPVQHHPRLDSYKTRKFLKDERQEIRRRDILKRQKDSRINVQMFARCLIEEGKLKHLSCRT